MPGKINASLSQKLLETEWGEYRIGDLFERIETVKLPYKAEDLPKHATGKYTLPCLTSSFKNQGLNYYAPRENATILRHVISIPSNSDVYRAYFQSKEFTVLSDAYAIRWKSNSFVPTQNQYLFMVMCINKITDRPIYSYKNKLGGWHVVKDKYIQLPKKNGDIDFTFMDSFIEQLQASRMSNLNHYLLNTGLIEYSLTDGEKHALQHYGDPSLTWKEFKLGDLFEVTSYKKCFNANTVKVTECGKFPYIVRMEANNGQKGYIDADETYLNKGNTISFGQDTATMFYQEHPYFTGDKIKILKPKNKYFNKTIAQFFLVSMRQAFRSFSWGASSFEIGIIENQKFKLPVNSNNDVDIVYIQDLISAIQKSIIKDIVLYYNEKLG